MKLNTIITGKGSISPLGKTRKDIINSYSSPSSCILPHSFSMGTFPGAALHPFIEEAIDSLKSSYHLYKQLDRTVLLAIYAAREALINAAWEPGIIGINIGSSRGATETLELRLEEFILSNKKTSSVYTSPSTTLGNIASWVQQDLGTNGPEISHSITCSTGMQAIANGIAWLKSGLVDKFLAGAAEAPLTDFTIAQMRALKIYANDLSDYPCRPFAQDEPLKNTMVLGEAGIVFALEQKTIVNQDKKLAEIFSIGFGNEKLTSPSSISERGSCLFQSMKMALEHMDTDDNIDLIICHAPGTILGDRAELNAIKSLFPDQMPMLTSNKWKIGHTLGASGLMSLEYGLALLAGEIPFSNLPYANTLINQQRPIGKILINAAGFGGSAMSIIIGK